MISEQDKQAILNGAYGITINGYCANTQVEAFDDLFSCCSSQNFNIIGLWQEKPEPFDLNRALKGECINYSGEPCYIYYSNRKTETHEYIVEASSGAFTLNLYFIGLNAGVFGAQVMSVLLVMALTCWAILAD